MNTKKRLHINPASEIVLGFLLVILIGTFLLCLPISNKSGNWLSFVDSFFTSISAVCVTGLGVVDLAVTFTLFGQIVILLLIQIGGLGIVTLSTMLFLIVGKRIGYKKRITIQESLNQDRTQGVVKSVIKILIITLTVELIGFICLLPSMIIYTGSAGKGIFSALFIAISAFCNAGFDVFGTLDMPFVSLSNFAQNSMVLIPIMFLIVIGGIGFIVLFDLLDRCKKGKKKLSIYSKIVLIFTAILIVGGSSLFMIFEWNNPNTIGNMSVWNKIVNSFFQSITPRTAGFSTLNQGLLSTQSKLLTGILMFIGGGSSSTAGGVKVATIFVLMLVIFKHSNSNGDIIYKNYKITNATIKKSIRVFAMSFALIFLSIFVICLSDGQFTLEQIMFETISAISTVGLSMGITALLSTLSKFVIIFLMFAGRVGAITLTVMLSSRFINKQKENSKLEEIEYQDSKIIVG